MSTIGAVLDALATLAAATLTDSQIINGPIGSVSVTKPRIVVIGDTPIVGERDLDSMSLSGTREEYDVPVTVSVDLAGADQGVADDEAMADYAALELAIREYTGGPNLGLSASGVRSALPLRQFQLERFSSSDGRSAAVKFFVHVYAQNT